MAAQAPVAAAGASRPRTPGEYFRPEEGGVLDALVPVIETERLVLRAPRVDDLDAVAGFFAGARSAFVGGPRDRLESWRNILMFMGHWVARGYGYWTVDDRASGRLVGRVGVHFHAAEWPEPELGWQLLAEFEGRGLMTEAARAARATVAERFGLDRVISLIAPDNGRSQALARRLGAVPERDCVVASKPATIWRHPQVAA